MQPEVAQKFLNTLGTSHTFQTFDDSSNKRANLARQFHGHLDQHADKLKGLNDAGAGVFVTVQQTDGRGRKATNIVAARALFVDVDTREDLAVPLPPSMRVRSSPGKEHIYWLLHPGEDLSRVPDAQRTLARELNTDPSVHDIARVMRIPGFTHRKKDPFITELVSIDADRRYTIDDVLSSLAAPDTGSTVDFARYRADKLLERLRLTTSGDRNNAVYRTVWQLKELFRDGTLSPRVLESAYRIATGLGLSSEEAMSCIRSAMSSAVPSDTYQSIKQPTDTSAAVAAVSLPKADNSIDVLPSGKEVDLGQTLLRQLGADTGRAKVVDGALYSYEDPGVWTEQSIVKLRGQVQSYHGAYVYDSQKKLVQLDVTTRKRDSAVDAALHDPAVQAPDFFGETPPGVLFANGFISPWNGHLDPLPPTPDYRCRTYLPIEWDIDSRAPEWETFLAELLPDHQERMCLQEAVGAAMYGAATQWAKCFVLLGHGSNGKSVFLKAIAKHLFQHSQVSFVPPGKWSHEYYVYALRNSLINLVPELPGWNIITTDTFKAVITGDPVLGRPPYGQTMQFAPRAGHFFACNELPATRDYSQGFWRRFRVISFDQIFDGTLTIDQVLDRFADEGSGIATWATIGMLRLMKNKQYTESAASKNVQKEWQEEADPVHAFVRHCCVLGEGETGAYEIYTKFTQWCTSTGRYAPSATKFGRRIKILGITRMRKKTGKAYQLSVKPVNEWEIC